MCGLFILGGISAAQLLLLSHLSQTLHEPLQQRRLLSVPGEVVQVAKWIGTYNWSERLWTQHCEKSVK